MSISNPAPAKRIRVWPNTQGNRDLVKALRHYEWDKAEELLKGAPVADASAPVMVDAVATAQRKTLLGWVMANFPAAQADLAAQLLYRHGARPFKGYRWSGQGDKAPAIVKNVFSGHFPGNFHIAKAWIIDYAQGVRTDEPNHQVAGMALWFDDPALWEKCILDEASLRKAIETARDYGNWPRNSSTRAERKLDWLWNKSLQLSNSDGAFSAMLRGLGLGALNEKAPLRRWLSKKLGEKVAALTWEEAVIGEGSQKSGFVLLMEQEQTPLMRPLISALQQKAIAVPRDKRLRVGQGLWETAATGAVSWGAFELAAKAVALSPEDWRQIMTTTPAQKEPLWVRWEQKKSSHELANFINGYQKWAGVNSWEDVGSDGWGPLHHLCGVSQPAQDLLISLAKKLPLSLWEKAISNHGNMNVTALNLLELNARETNYLEIRTILERRKLLEAVEYVAPTLPRSERRARL